MSQKTIAKGYSGLLIPDERLTPDSEYAEIGSTLTQASPRPGQAIPQQDNTEAVVVTSNLQGDATQKIIGIRGGFPPYSEYGWMTSINSLSSDYRGCNWPNFAGDIRNIGGGTTSITSSGATSSITAKSGRIIWAWGQTESVGSTNTIYVSYSDDMITIVGADGSIPVMSDDLTSDQYYGTSFDNLDCIALHWDATRDVAQLFIRIEDTCAPGSIQYCLFESEDEGETWALSQRNCLRGAYTPTYDCRRPIVGSIGGELVLLHGEDNSADYQYSQWHSADHGRNFELLSSDATTKTNFCMSNYAEKLAIAAVDTATSYAVMTSIGSAYEVAEAGDWSRIGNLSSASDVCLVAQHGRLFAYCITGTKEEIRARMSTTLDPTDFVPVGHEPFTFEDATTNVEFSKLSGAASFGAVILAYRVGDTGTESEFRAHLFAHRMGGWSTVTLPTIQSANPGYLPARVAFGSTSLSVSGTIFDHTRATWFPWCAPDAIAIAPWIADGTGTDTAGITIGDSPYREIVCGVGTHRRFKQSFDEDMDQGILAYFDVQPVGGGSTTSDDHGVQVVLSNGSTEYDLFVRIGHSGVVLVDGVGGGDSGNLNNPAGSRRMFFLAMRETETDTTAIATLYKAKYDAIGNLYGMEELGSINLDPNTTTASADSTIQFGVIGNAAATTTADWFAFCYLASSGTKYIQDLAIGNVINNIDKIGGAPCSSTPVYTTDGLNVSFSGGPVKAGEIWTVTPKYDYAVKHVYPRLYPSPRQTWRSTADGTDNTIEWAFDTDDFTPQGMGAALWGVAVINANFANWKLDGYTPAGAWENIITVDASDEFTSLPYRVPVRSTFSGPYVTVNTSGSGSATRYIHENELAGGTVIIGAAQFKILRNTSGYWSTTAGKKPVLFMETWDPAIATTGTLDIWPPNSMAIKQGLGSTEYTKLRFVVSAVSTADGYYSLGNLVIGPVYLFGKRYSKGRVLTRSANSVVNYTQGGASNPVKYGPSYRTVEFGWFEGLDQTDIYYLNDEPDYVTVGDATGVAYAAASRFDMPTNLDGLHGYLDGGNVPVVYIPNIPYDASEAQFTTTDGASINGFIYGRIVGDVKLSTVTGVEQLSEVAQIAAIQIREEK